MSEERETTAAEQQESANKLLKVRNEQSRFQQHFRQGLTILIVVILSIAFYFLLLRAGTLSDYIANIVRILRPVLYGVVIAYLLNPVMVFVERLMMQHVLVKMKNQRRAEGIARISAVLLALAFGISIVVALGLMILPELFASIRGLIFTLPRQMEVFIDWFSEWQRADNEIGQFLEDLLMEGTDYLETWLRNDLLGQINIMMTSLTAGVIGFVREVANIIIGVVVSAYTLFSKEKFAGSSKKITYALLGTERANFFIAVVRKSHEIFGGFISGKLLDSAIIGVICFICMTIMDLPYILLVSVIIGVTNVIPFFGPYIGGIPCALLIALVDPMQGVYFGLFIIVLQQVDGNLIGPTILGDSTGLSPFWIIVAILVGGGLFGFVGMVMGVPTLAVIFYIINLFTERKLEERRLPLDASLYDDLAYIDPETGEAYFQSAETRKKNQKQRKQEDKKKRQEQKKREKDTEE